MDNEDYIVNNFLEEKINLLDQEAIIANKQFIVDKVKQGECFENMQLKSIFRDLRWPGIDQQSDDELLYTVLCTVGVDKLSKLSDWEIDRGETAGYLVDGDLIPDTISGMIDSCITYGWATSMEWILNNIEAGGDGFDIGEYLEESYDGIVNSLYNLHVTILISGSVPMLHLMINHDFIKDMDFEIDIDSRNWDMIDRMITTLILGDFDIENISTESWEELDDDGTETRLLKLRWGSERLDGNLFETALQFRLNDIIRLMEWPDIDEKIVAYYAESKIGEDKHHITMLLQYDKIQNIMYLPVPLESRIVLAETGLLGRIASDRIALDKLLNLR